MAKDTCASVDDRLLRDVDQISATLDAGLELGACKLTSSLRRGRRVGRNRGTLERRDGTPKDSASDIFGQVDQDGTRATRGGNLEGFVDSPRQFGDVLNHHVPLCASPGDTNNVRLLEGVGANRSRRHLTAENNHGSAVHQGILHGSDNVGGTRTGGHEDNASLARSAGVTLGHVAGALLVSGKDKVEVFAVVDGIENGENGTARVADWENVR